MEEEKIPLTERIKQIEEIIGKKKERKIRLGKAKVRGSRLKKGYLGVLKVDSNRCGTFTKVEVDGGAFDFNNKDYHATRGSEIILINGKFPLIIQPTWKRNPINIMSDEENETYGDEMALAKMMKDIIKVKKGGNMNVIFIIAIIAIVGYALGKFVFKWF